MILLSGYKHAFFANWLANIHNNNKKWRTCAYVHHFFFPYAHIHLLADWTNSFLNDGELSIIYLLCWSDEIVTVVAVAAVFFSLVTAITASPTPSVYEKWIQQQLTLPAYTTTYEYSFRLSIGMNIENHSKCNLSSPSVCSAHILMFIFTFYVHTHAMHVHLPILFIRVRLFVCSCSYKRIWSRRQA